MKTLKIIVMDPGMDLMEIAATQTCCLGAEAAIR